MLKKNNKVKGLKIPDFIAIIFKTVLYWNRNRHLVQWNKTEQPGIISYIYSQLIVYQGIEIIQWGRIVFSTTSLGKLDIHAKNEVGFLLHTIFKKLTLMAQRSKY